MNKVIKITKKTAKELLPKRTQFSSKGSYGKVLNISGSYKYQGAASLSSLAPLKVGCGLVTLATIESVINNLAGNVPCITFHKLEDFDKKCISKNAFDNIKEIIKYYSVISIGSGLSDDEELDKFITDTLEFLTTNNTKCVIDADALNIAARLGIEKYPTNAIITPHPVEMSRLLNISVTKIQDDRIKHAQMATEKFGCNVILKGHETIISLTDGRIFQNTTGNSALAKAGSGDVLTGMISGFAAQNMTIENATILAVYLHGLCGEIASKELSEYSVLSTDLINYIPKAIKTII